MYVTILESVALNSTVIGEKGIQIIWKEAAFAW
jgi:hypothetical protein